MCCTVSCARCDTTRHDRHATLPKDRIIRARETKMLRRPVLILMSAITTAIACFEGVCRKGGQFEARIAAMTTGDWPPVLLSNGQMCTDPCSFCRSERRCCKSTYTPVRCERCRRCMSQGGCRAWQHTGRRASRHLQQGRNRACTCNIIDAVLPGLRHKNKHIISLSPALSHCFMVVAMV